MQPWYVKNLGDATLAIEELNSIKQLLLDYCLKTGSTNGVQAYFRHVSEGRLHCELKVYFSPDLADVAQSMGAIPCVKPSANDLGSLFD